MMVSLVGCPALKIVQKSRPVKAEALGVMGRPTCRSRTSSGMVCPAAWLACKVLSARQQTQIMRRWGRGYTWGRTCDGMQAYLIWSPRCLVCPPAMTRCCVCRPRTWMRTLAWTEEAGRGLGRFLTTRATQPRKENAGWKTETRYWCMSACSHWPTRTS